MSKKHQKAIAAALQAPHPTREAGAKAQLVITPQIPVQIHGTFPDQYLTVEDPSGGHRGKTVLTPDNAYSVLIGILMAKAGEIELERQLREERTKAPARKRAQPDWRLIAKHPEATIIERLPTASPELKSLKAELNLEEMGL